MKLLWYRYVMELLRQRYVMVGLSEICDGDAFIEKCDRVASAEM